ncbi:peptidoglycan-binding protein [Leucobacter sp. UCMA 4100]|uniref:peptidoglycan-binding protein n=1 Tax=Leucobacter sp. UCMA 4100 TaxID=2810534 RepID=UPI0022EAC9B6|nr:peptidoglycan-binding protein [Leucobacter sp. UCMA 4100]MDA3147186.1 peptidoglycan-binding protein [Leucobacter sp. UCMA 4100]
MAKRTTSAPENTPRRRRIVMAIVTVAILGTLGGGAALIVPAMAQPSPEQKDSRVNVGTDVVSRGDLTERVRAGGTMSYGTGRPLGSSLPGTVTSVAAAGTEVGRGEELLRIDDQPVVLLFGSLPAWRGFTSGMTPGRDVRQLEENLRDLGFFEQEPDEKFTWWTAEAIRRWQQARGLERTGELPFGSFVFEPKAVRIASVDAAPGSASSESILTVTDTDKRITIDIDADLVAVAEKGSKVSVSLPDGVTVEATVASVGAPVQKEGENGEKVMKVSLILTPDDPAIGGDLIDVTVTATFTRTLASDVIRVPVLALLAGPDGITQVEVIDGEQSRLVTITTGAFGDGLVEITDGDLAEGDTVVVAQ